MVCQGLGINARLVIKLFTLLICCLLIELFIANLASKAAIAKELLWISTRSGPKQSRRRRLHPPRCHLRHHSSGHLPPAQMVPHPRRLRLRPHRLVPCLQLRQARHHHLQFMGCLMSPLVFWFSAIVINMVREALQCCGCNKMAWRGRSPGVGVGVCTRVSTVCTSFVCMDKIGIYGV